MADRFKEIVTTNGTNATWSITPYTGETAGTPALRVKDNGEVTGNAVTLSSLAGTGTRMVVADSTGNLSAPLNRFQNIYVEGNTSEIGNNTWIKICDCPIGSTDIAVTTFYEPFENTALYYSQAGFARATGGTAVAIYIADGGASGTRIRLNGNSIEALQTSGASVSIKYRYTTKNARN